MKLIKKIFFYSIILFLQPNLNIKGMDQSDASDKFEKGIIFMLSCNPDKNQEILNQIADKQKNKEKEAQQKEDQLFYINLRTLDEKEIETEEIKQIVSQGVSVIFDKTLLKTNNFDDLKKEFTDHTFYIILHSEEQYILQNSTTSKEEKYPTMEQLIQAIKTKVNS